MLKKILPISIYMIVSLFFILSFFFYSSKKNIEENFLRFKEKNQKPKTAYQKRENVQKDLFIAAESSRDHVIIKSKSSDVFLDQASKAQLKEKLNNIDVVLEENSQKLFKQIKIIKAKEGIYYYPKQKLELFDVDTFFYNLLQDASLENLDLNSFFFKSSAKKIGFYLLEKKPKINFFNLEGTITPERILECRK